MKVEYFAKLLNPVLNVQVRTVENVNLEMLTAEQLKNSKYKNRTVSGFDMSPCINKNFVAVNIL